MTDRIVLRGVTARGHHGVLDFERRDGQTFVVDVTLEVDLAPAGTSDALADTVNYAEVAADVVAVVEGEPVDLIETVAARIAARALTRPLVEAVEVVIHKPEAPVGVPFTDVEVHIRRERSVPVVIALGANLGDREQTLADAEVALEALPLRRVRFSEWFETEPVGGPEQPAYLNGVVTGLTRLGASALLRRLHEIEAQYGRTREVRWGARTLDLDLIQYGRPGGGDEVRSDDPELTLPHPRAHERGFVLVPWLDADPEARLRFGDEVIAVRDLLTTVDTSGVRPFEEDE